MAETSDKSTHFIDSLREVEADIKEAEKKVADLKTFAQYLKSKIGVPEKKAVPLSVPFKQAPTSGITITTEEVTAYLSHMGTGDMKKVYEGRINLFLKKAAEAGGLLSGLYFVRQVRKLGDPVKENTFVVLLRRVARRGEIRSGGDGKFGPL